MSAAPPTPDEGSPFLFRRTALAERIAGELRGEGIFGQQSGLFLAAPRRTGKSTFLREDLVPALEARNATTIYVDLWADRQRDPAALIHDALKAALRAAGGGLTRRLQGWGLSKVGVPGVIGLDIDRVGAAQEGATLTEALSALVRGTGRAAALIVDEAQQALSTEAGTNAMFALKAARDALNQGRAGAGGVPATGAGPNLMLVFTGSHRDKLAHLVLKRDQPFFGADVIDFPLLGREYSDAYAAWVNARLAPEHRLDAEALFEAFEVLGRRPEMLVRVARDAAFGPGTGGLAALARAQRERLWEDHDREHEAMSPAQRAVLGHLIRQGADFAPFTAASLAAYEASLGRPVGTGEVQTALDGLRGRNAVWRSARGTYTLEDQDMATWARVRGLA